MAAAFNTKSSAMAAASNLQQARVPRIKEDVKSVLVSH